MITIWIETKLKSMGLGRSRPKKGSRQVLKFFRYFPSRKKFKFLAENAKPTPLDYAGGVYFVISLGFLLVSWPLITIG